MAKQRMDSLTAFIFAFLTSPDDELLTNFPLVRLNLSEQTDLSDLFRSDVPVLGNDGKSTFAWKDGPVLEGIKQNAWILLDEMNLASQAVLEGLNSCFDFPKDLYMGQLKKTFMIEKTRCRLFACQNPRSQGVSRKALPKSFMNCSTSIFVDEMTGDDFVFLLQQRFGDVLAQEVIRRMANFQVVATVNTGTDHGKKEFSLALRNRFMEIWCSLELSAEKLRSIASTLLSVENSNQQASEYAEVTILDELNMAPPTVLEALNRESPGSGVARGLLSFKPSVLEIIALFILALLLFAKPAQAHEEGMSFFANHTCFDTHGKKKKKTAANLPCSVHENV